MPAPNNGGISQLSLEVGGKFSSAGCEGDVRIFWDAFFMGVGVGGHARSCPLSLSCGLE